MRAGHRLAQELIHAGGSRPRRLVTAETRGDRHDRQASSAARLAAAHEARQFGTGHAGQLQIERQRIAWPVRELGQRGQTMGGTDDMVSLHFQQPA